MNIQDKCVMTASGVAQLKSSHEISLRDIFDHVKDFYKIILVAGVSGLAISSGYLFVLQDKYVGTAYISVAEVKSFSGKLVPQITALEEPSRLLSRLEIIGALSSQMPAECKLTHPTVLKSFSHKNPSAELINNLPNAIKLRVFGDSPQAIQNCVDSYLKFIKATQSQMLASYIAENKIRLDLYEEQLKKTIIHSKSYPVALSDSSISFEEFRMITEIVNLRALLKANQEIEAYLLVPTNVKSFSSGINFFLALVLGPFAGFILGLFLVYCSIIWSRLKVVAQ